MMPTDTNPLRPRGEQRERERDTIMEAASSGGHTQWWRGLEVRLTHTPRLGSTPLGVGLAGESGVSLQPVASLAAHLTLRPVGRPAIAAPQEAVWGASEGRAGANCRGKKKD